LQPLLGDVLAALLASPERARVYAVESCRNGQQQIVLILQHPDCDFLIEVVGRKVGQMQRCVGKTAAGLATCLAQSRFPQHGDTAAQTGRQAEQALAVDFEVLFIHCCLITSG
jgi:hypothetical protein